MRLLAFHQSGFRNLRSERLELAGPAHWILGANGQGKTNLLEALGLMTALRSFRTAESDAWLNWGRPGEARLVYELEHERQGETRIEIVLRPKGKELWVDGERVPRLAEHLGLFPTVALSSLDLQLLRGAPGLRRRWLDLVLSCGNPAYFAALQRLHKGLDERNALLRRRAPARELHAFELPLAEAAALVVTARTAGLKQLGEAFTQAYRTLAPVEETPLLQYRPDLPGEAPEVFLKAWEAARERDLVLVATSRGPHRDDFTLGLQDHRARDFASEGQQRGLVLALRLAQVAWLRARTGIAPVILADDILGELDATRRLGFWQALPADLQVFATGTARPGGDGPHAWQLWRATAGALAAEA